MIIKKFLQYEEIKSKIKHNLKNQNIYCQKSKYKIFFLNFEKS